MKPRILLCWNYSRPNWTEPFERLNDSFDFVYLAHYRRGDEGAVYTQSRRIFYMDYASPAALLRDIKPHRVVFMGLDGLQNVAINAQCQRDGIPTCFMAHGAGTYVLDDHRTFPWKERRIYRKALVSNLLAWSFTLQFLIRGLGTRFAAELPSLLRYQLDQLKEHPLLAMKRHPVKARIPNQYFLMLEGSKEIYRELDGAREEQFIVLGDFEIAYLVERAARDGSREDGYLLYLETPLSVIEGSEFGEGILPIEEHNRLIMALNRCAIARGLRLVVKLHPYSFENSYFPVNENITYERQSDRIGLILNAKAVIFYSTSLAIAALFAKPCCMFTIGALDNFQRTISQLGVCHELDHETLVSDPDALRFGPTSPNGYETFLDEVLGMGADGQALSRLDTALRAS